MTHEVQQDRHSDYGLTIVYLRLGVNHRVVTVIFGSHPSSDESEMAQCQVTAACTVERMQSTAENPA